MFFDFSISRLASLWKAGHLITWNSCSGWSGTVIPSTEVFYTSNSIYFLFLSRSQNYDSLEIEVLKILVKSQFQIPFDQRRSSTKLFCFFSSYNALERRETCKGGKEASKKFAASQSSAKNSTTGSRSHTSHNSRRHEATSTVNSSNQSGKTSRPSSSCGSPVYDEQVVLVLQYGCEFFLFRISEHCNDENSNAQITELKLSIDSLEKERDFYFSKLRDIEILCQSHEIQDSKVEVVPWDLLSIWAQFKLINSVLQVVSAIKKILYAGEDDASVVADAQAMVSMATQKEAETRTEGITDKRENLETQKRKVIQNHDIDAVGITTLSPRLRISGVSDVHCSGSHLTSYWLWMELWNFLISFTVHFSFGRWNLKLSV